MATAPVTEINGPSPNQDDAQTANRQGASIHTQAPPEVASTTAGPFAAPEARDVHNAFLLGWSVAELIGRIQVPVAKARTPSDAPTELDNTETFLPFVTEASDAFWMISMWRVNFERISQLTNVLFPNSSTLNTRWDPGDRQPAYLYPAKPQDDPEFVDYADIGSIQSPAGGQILPQFRLHEATRRALNTLSLLKLSAKTSLLPEVLTQQQQQLVQAVLGVQAPAGGSNSGEPVGPSGEDLQKSAEVITARLLLFLHAWEGYLRESAYAAGAEARNEAVLMAFEAGRSMAALSWGISVDTALGKPRAPMWDEAFSDTNVSRLQHQIAVMTQAFRGAQDTASEDRGGGTATEGANEGNTPGADGLLVVARSLDYWQRATAWLKANNAIDTQWDKILVALIEQAGVWQSLCLAQVSVTSYTSPGVIQRILQDVVESFETLATQRGIIEAGQEAANAAVVLAQQALERVEKLEDATAAALKSARHQMVSVVFSMWPIILVGIVAIIAVAAGIVLLGQTSSSQAAGGSLAATLLAIVGGLGLWGTHNQTQRLVRSLDTPPSAPPSLPAPDESADSPGTPPAAQTLAAQAPPRNLADRLGALFGRAADTVMDDFEKGFRQIQFDLRYLSRTVAVSYPLIEYFVQDDTIEHVHDPFDFIESIIWNKVEQKQEVLRVAYAAFGAIGSFAMTEAFKREGASEKGAG